MLDLKDKKVTILGLKRTGMSLAKMVLRLGGIARISEQHSKEECPDKTLQWLAEKNITMEFGGHTKDFIEDSDVVVLSPGIPFDAPIVVWALEKNIAILGEVEFAAQFCTKPIIAVTGSNGKTTVVNLLHMLLQAAGYRSVLCGNIGEPFSEFVLDLKDKDFVVLEVSSFQLESILDTGSIFRAPSTNGRLSFKGFQPFIGVFLNFGENHLDRHPDLVTYFNAKKRMFLNQSEDDFAVLNAQNRQVKNLDTELKSQVVYFNNKGLSVDNPNHSAVREIARILKINSNVCEDVFDKFKGVEHRLEWVKSISQRQFLNDSKATTAQATQWALERIEKPILMICGGRDKNIDFSILKGLVRAKVKRMFVIGEAKGKIKKIFGDVIDIAENITLEDAVAEAWAYSDAGDCILLSPMCASFDMFADYEDRGRVFKEIVNNLTN